MGMGMGMGLGMVMQIQKEKEKENPFVKYLVKTSPQGILSSLHMRMVFLN